MDRKEEVKIKLSRVRKFMEENGFQAVLFKKQPNFSWITGGGLNMVGIATEMGVTSILVTKDNWYLIANKIEAPRMRDEEVSDLDVEVLEHEWYEVKEMEFVRKIVGDGRIASDTYVPGLEYVEEKLKELRYELTEAEIERYLYLGSKLSESLEKVLMEVKPGMRECEIAGMISAEIWKYRIDPTGFMVAADDRARLYRHPIPTTRKIEKYVMVSVNARYKGLITTVTRIVHFGKLPEKLSKQYLDNVEIECVMISKSRPGTRLCDVLNAAIEEYEKRGYHDEWKLHHQGGPMGYTARDIRVTPRNTEPIRPNQAICWNPTISGTKSEDGFIATQNGPIMITKPILFPKLRIEVEGLVFEKPAILEL